jgi:hypothetical protein
MRTVGYGTLVPKTVQFKIKFQKKFKFLWVVLHIEIGVESFRTDIQNQSNLKLSLRIENKITL